MDVGHAELGAEDYSGKLRFNGYNGIGIGVSQLPTANALDVDKAVRAELTRLSKRFPPGLEYAIAFDTTTFVGDSIREVLKTLVEAIVCVMLVMFLFLQDWRSTLIPAVTIPVSLIGAFAFIKLLDFSINTLTLFGIVLATGLVVDDAIVVIENIQRHMGEEHMRLARGRLERHGRGHRRGGRDLAGAGRRVRAGGVLPRNDRTALQAVLADHRVLHRDLRVQLADLHAVAVSACCSGRRLARRTSSSAAWNASSIAPPSYYVASANRAVKLRYLVLVVFFAGLAATYVVYKIVPTGFVPDEDQGWFMITVQAPQGASVEYTSQAMRQVEAVCAKEKDIIGAFSVVGFSFTGSGANKGMVFLNLANIDKRKGAAELRRGGRQSPARPVKPVDRHPGVPVPAAGDLRHQQLRRLHLRGAGRGRQHRAGALQRDPGPGAGRELRARTSAACSAHSPRTIRSSW